MMHRYHLKAPLAMHCFSEGGADHDFEFEDVVFGDVEKGFPPRQK